jgi:hypothetical protein
MAVYGEKFQSLLNVYQQKKCLFSEIQNSTSSVEGKLSNVLFDEREIMPLLFSEGTIIAIDSNFGHVKCTMDQLIKSVVTVLSYFDITLSAEKLAQFQLGPKKKSNRGRKKKKKVRKNRKYQGDGTGFNSQITFTILGGCARRIPETLDIYSQSAVKTGGGNEIIIKEYKIKVFRNGKFTVPGIRVEDFSDLTEPMKQLCKYLEIVLMVKHVKVLNIGTTMRNYKFKLLEGNIDLKKLYEICRDLIKPLITVNIDEIIEVILHPTFTIGKRKVKTRKWISTAYILHNEPLEITWPNMASHGIVTIRKQKLKTLIDSLDFEEDYKKILTVSEYLGQHHIGNEQIKDIFAALTASKTDTLRKEIMHNIDNLIFGVEYNPERFPGLLLYIKTPDLSKKNGETKKTTIKMFKQKINIDGANNKYETQCIYSWLNALLTKHKFDVIYNDDEIKKVEIDEEFSNS